ncbi:MAG: hypothetical protein OCD76_06320 [Reichenbachiella sp.]
MNEPSQDLVEPVTEKQVLEAIKVYLENKNDSASVKMILTKPVKLLENYAIEISILNKVETSMIQNVEIELMDFLRNSLKNTALHITYNVAKNHQDRRPYTSTEIFATMAKKNPLLLKLRDNLGLDTDF